MNTPRDLPSALARLDALQAKLDALRPLDADAVGRAMQRLRLEWTYHSNAIEGNSLTYGETRALLMEGVTAHGKPLKDHIDIERHRDVILFIEDIVGSDTPLRVGFVKEIHRQLMGESYEIEAETPDGARVKRTMEGGAYKELPNNVKTPTGEVHYYAPPLEVPGRMAELIDWLGSDEAEAMHPVARLAVFHHRFVEIHPFPDGNGRTSRVLMNVLFMRAGYVPAVLRQERRRAYYGALAEAGAGDDEPIIAFVGGELVETMELYVRAVKGEPDPTAFDKRAELLSREVEGMGSVHMTDERKRRLVIDFLYPLIKELEAQAPKLTTFFEKGRLNLEAADEAGERRFGPEAKALLDAGEYTSFAWSLRLDDLKSNPGSSMGVHVSGKIEKAALRLAVSPAEEADLTYRGNQLPGEREARRLAEQQGTAALDWIEAAIRHQQGKAS